MIMEMMTLMMTMMMNNDTVYRTDSAYKSQTRKRKPSKVPESIISYLG